MKVIPTVSAIALALAAPFALSTPVLAQEMNLDANQDGIVDADEWGAYGDEFDSWDANDDGLIDENEWTEGVNTAFGGTPGGGDDDGPLFGVLDPTDDNQIGEDEFFNDESFGELDDNEDGVLDQDEFGA